MGSKSMVAAPLWADNNLWIPNSIMQTTELMGITQILHQQGFDDPVHACHQPQIHFSG